MYIYTKKTYLSCRTRLFSTMARLICVHPLGCPEVTNLGGAARPFRCDASRSTKDVEGGKIYVRLMSKRYPLVNHQFANLNMAIEIMSFPIHTVIFHSYASLPEGSSWYVDKRGRCSRLGSDPTVPGIPSGTRDIPNEYWNEINPTINHYQHVNMFMYVHITFTQ